jgi:hypothetical protein
LILKVEKVKSHVGLKISAPHCLTTNGTAIWLGNVTRRSYPANCPVCWQGICPGSETGMARYLQSRVWLFVRSRYDDERY